MIKMQFGNKLSLGIGAIMTAITMTFVGYLGLHGVKSTEYIANPTSNGGVELFEINSTYRLFSGTDSEVSRAFVDEDGDGDVDLFSGEYKIELKYGPPRKVFMVAPESQQFRSDYLGDEIMSMPMLEGDQERLTEAYQRILDNEKVIFDREPHELPKLSTN